MSVNLTFGSLILISGVFGLSLTVVGSVASAADVVLKRPVLDPGVTLKDRGALERELEPLLDLSDTQLASLVPERNGLLFCGCPNCDSGAQDGQMTWMGWENPDEIKCHFCDMAFPNDEYPENETITAKNPHGEQIVFRYHQSPKGRHFFSARARYERKRMLGHLTLQMARLAHLTKDPVHERKAIVLLNSFGDKYPGWCVMADRAFTLQGPLDSHPEKPRHYFGGIWSRWFYNDIPHRLLMAYDLVYESPQWERLSEQQTGLDVRGRLENDVFRAAVDFVRGYEDRLGNKSPGIYTGMIVAGRVLGAPDYVHEAVDRFRRLVRSKFFFDGMWHEGSISYHRQTLSGLQQVIDLVAGYSDPEGYQWPKDGSHFEDLDLIGDFPFLQKVKRAESSLVFPNGRIVPVHDAWADRTREQREPPQTKLLAGMQHCCLHRGSGANQMQTRLHFAPGIRHKHNDLLSMILWAGGRELLSDIGYTHTNVRRAWTRMTAAHNTVVVNETEQKVDGDRADLSLFDVAEGLLQTVEATATASYPHVTNDYRRQLIQVDISADQAYVVDVFRVSGGNRHDWFLHGSANFDQTATTSLQLQPLDGTLLGPDASIRMPGSERDDGDAGDRNISYAFIRDLAQQETDNQWSATFRFDQQSPVQLRTTVLGQPGTTVVLGKCPSVRRANEDNSKIDDFLMPVIAARRSGENLTSAFVAVHEPYQDRPFIRSVRRLTPAGDPAGPVALEIVREDHRDIVICATDEYADQLVTIPSDPPIEFSGRTGFVRFHGAEVSEAYLLDGIHLRCADVELMPSSAPQGVMTNVLRESDQFGFRVREQIPTDGRFTKRTILVTLSDNTRYGYRITGIEPSGDGSVILLDEDPGFAIRGDSKTEFLYYPQRELTGQIRYRIFPTARWKRDG